MMERLSSEGVTNCSLWHGQGPNCWFALVARLEKPGHSWLYLMRRNPLSLSIRSMVTRSSAPAELQLSWRRRFYDSAIGWIGPTSRTRLLAPFTLGAWLADQVLRPPLWGDAVE